MMVESLFKFFICCSSCTFLTTLSHPVDFVFLPLMRPYKQNQNQLMKKYLNLKSSLRRESSYQSLENDKHIPAPQWLGKESVKPLVCFLSDIFNKH